jgi:NADH-quinone oxidoreductase subunit L
MSATTYAWLVLAFPLAGTLVIALGWRVLPGRLAGWLGSFAILLSFAAGVGALLELLALPEEERSLTASAFDYASTAGLDADLGILVDPLSVFMVLVVSGVSFLIHLYSVAYIASDGGYARFFSYLNFFVFSMLLLVLAGNFVLLIVGWAFVGAASYLLISFWYRRMTATAAGIKAFVINVVGDVGLVLATFLLFQATGALDYAGVFTGAEEAFAENDGTLVAACLLLLVGAFAKSAQIPLHTWLPDAMEGPTPVSALIHAATMVTAGVYLIARTHPLFELAPAAADVAAIIGTLTLVMAATIALVVTDLKRVIAYSTMSQIGYMVLGVSVFAYGAGLFHLMTHAFFKALLFMGAGSVIGAMGGEQSLDRMGGFRKAMPFTFATFTLGALALAGAPLLSGFFSKDEILAFTIDRGGGYVILGVVGYVAALITAFYAFRMVFRVFFGKAAPEAAELARGGIHHADPQNPATGEVEDSDVGFPGPEHHVAERSAPMAAAMAPLALLSVVAGLVAIPGVTDTLEHFLEPTFADSRFIDVHPSESAEYIGLAVGGAIGLLGIAIAYVLYMRRPGVTLALRDRLRPVHSFLARKWYFDELLDALFVRPAAGFGRFGRTVVESALVQGLLVGGASGAVRAGTSFARTIQSGYLRAYALLLFVGVSGLALYFLIASA